MPREASIQTVEDVSAQFIRPGGTNDCQGQI